MHITETLRERKTALTVDELALILSVSPRQLYKLAAANRIPHFKVASSVRFDPGTVLEWYEEHELRPPRRPPASERGSAPRRQYVA